MAAIELLALFELRPEALGIASIERVLHIGG